MAGIGLSRRRGSRSNRQMSRSGMRIRRSRDPAKVANVILQVAAVEQPPVRLLIGSSTMRYAHSFDQARAAADEKWKALTALGD